MLRLGAPQPHPQGRLPRSVEPLAASRRGPGAPGHKSSVPGLECWQADRSGVREPQIESGHCRISHSFVPKMLQNAHPAALYSDERVLTKILQTHTCARRSNRPQAHGHINTVAPQQCAPRGTLGTAPRDFSRNWPLTLVSFFRPPRAPPTPAQLVSKRDRKVSSTPAGSEPSGIVSAGGFYSVATREAPQPSNLSDAGKPVQPIAPIRFRAGSCYWVKAEDSNPTPPTPSPPLSPFFLWLLASTFSV